MNLYLISQNKNNDYDTYDSAVVAAPDEETARNIDPNQNSDDLMMDWTNVSKKIATWCFKPEEVEVQLIGVAIEGTKLGVICASFNAG